MGAIREPHNWDVGDWLGILAAFGSVALLMWRRVARPVWATVTSIVSAPRRITEVMELVKHELTPNSGASLKDKVENTSTVLSTLTNEFTILTRTVDGLRVGQTLLLSEMAVPVWESNAEGKCVWINETFTRETGWVSSEMAGDSWRENIVHQDDRELVSRAWDDAVRRGSVFRLTYRWRTKDGRTLLIEGRTKPIEGRAGLTGYFGMARILER